MNHRCHETAFEKKTGWKYSITATNITKRWGVPGSHQVQWIEPPRVR